MFSDESNISEYNLVQKRHYFAGKNYHTWDTLSNQEKESHQTQKKSKQSQVFQHLPQKNSWERFYNQYHSIEG